MDADQIEKDLSKLVGLGGGIKTSPRAALVDRTSCAHWVLRCQTLIRSVFGEGHPIDLAISKAKEFEYASTAELAMGAIQAARDAWKDGHVFDLKALVRADVESDLIGQATELLERGYERAAGVVAGAVVEERLRAVALSWGVSIADAKGKPLTMEPLNIELKKAGAYDGIMQKRITLLGGLRNKAAHGEPFENRAADIEGMIRDALRICGEVKPK